jgi:hypothetical protein
MEQGKHATNGFLTVKLHAIATLIKYLLPAWNKLISVSV